MARQEAKLQKEKPDASLHQSKDSSKVLAPFQQEYENSNSNPSTLIFNPNQSLW